MQNKFFSIVFVLVISFMSLAMGIAEGAERKASAAKAKPVAQLAPSQWNTDMWMLINVDTLTTLSSDPENCYLKNSYPLIQYRDAKPLADPATSEILNQEAEKIRNKANKLIRNKRMLVVNDLDMYLDPGACTDGVAIGNKERTMDLTPTDVYFDTDIYSVRFASDYYMGGASPSTGASFLMIDLKTGEELQFANFVKAEAFSVLKQKVINQVNADEGEDSAQDFEEALTGFDQLNGFAKAEGLMIEFDGNSPGILGSYTYISVLVPWSELSLYLLEPAQRIVSANVPVKK